MIQSLVLDLHPVASKNATQLTNIVPYDFSIYADACALRRVFQNLIANAIKYCPGGEVVIGASEKIETGMKQCFVRDNGEGMTKERCLVVFDKHETDPEKAGGLGLGLAIVKMLVEAHGGTATVDSKVGSGSTFYVTLPSRAN